MRLLCKIGLHKWRRRISREMGFHEQYFYNQEFKECVRCGKLIMGKINNDG